ncbi:unnamed protein product [Peniophora sp. CBMAI 1063]|nr:unnamed protein product [Peniophora sp. CBMAI 1063]
MLDPDVVLKTSPEVTLGEIWNVDERENICAHTDCPRDCENEEIAIKYQNTKGSDHSFFISLNRDEPFKTYEQPANLPVIHEAKGSCFSEKGRDWRIEPEPHRKKVDRALKKDDAFAKYCEGKLHTFCTAEKLEVIDDEEFERREVAKRKEKEDRRERWGKKLGTELVPVEDGRYSSSLDESGEEMSDDGF